MDKPANVVTGGAQGVGQAISRRLAEHGHVVVPDGSDELGWVDPAVELVVGTVVTTGSRSRLRLARRRLDR